MNIVFAERQGILVLKNNVIFLDGAMGTMLQHASLLPGEAPELYQMRHPEVIEAVHAAYLDAGSDILYTNTFGANAHKLKDSGYSVEEVIEKAVQIAKHGAQGKAKIALSIGPIGELLQPNGYLTFEEAYDIFSQQVQAGKKAGADLIVFETMSDLLEVKAAVLAAKEQSDLPVFVTMSFESDGRTFTGCSAASFALVADALHVDALGINCSLGPKQLFAVAQEIRKYTNLPMIVKANAGLPDPQSGAYDLSEEDYAQQLLQFAKLGVRYVGGCCGTTPAYIKKLKEVYPHHVEVFSQHKQAHICSATSVLALRDVHVIGERINPTGNKQMKLALQQHNYHEILQIALAQVEAGASILDVNVGLPGIDEVSCMVEIIKELQSVVDVPLQIDSTNPEVIEAALRVYCGIPIVNSINAEAKTMDAILPLIHKYGACVVALTMDERGIMERAVDRVAIGKHIIETAQSYGIEKERIFLDCLTLTVSAQQQGAMQTLQALTMIRDELHVLSVLGVSNISFGLPNRIILNQNFLTMALQAGLNLPIINPNQGAMMNAVRAFRVLTSLDVDAQDYISSCVVVDTPVIASSMMNIRQAIAKGLKEETKALTIQLLKEKEPMRIVDEDLIPALDEVGIAYEAKKLYLPQLINAASAAQMAFRQIRTHLQAHGQENISKGKILLATVKGDVHDIGKNIVKVVLENYGYQVYDLGKDVAIERVVETAVKENIYLIGLSALMTTTLPAMEATIKALHDAHHDCKIMVGGAVVSPSYAQSIHADFYAKDAKQSADIAKEVLG